jgi:signal transduction histidine kinase
MAATGRPVRSRRIRLFLISIFFVPLISLAALWAVAALLTVPPAISDHNYSDVSAAYSTSSILALGSALPAEQEETYLWLLGGRKGDKSALLGVRATVSSALSGAEAKFATGENQLSEAGRADLNTLEADLRGIPGLRQSVDAGRMTAAAAFQAYSDIVDAQYQMYYASALDRGGSLQAVSVGATDGGLALQMVTREAMLVDGALTVSRGVLSPGARQLFISSAASRQFLMRQSLSLLSPTLRVYYSTIENSLTYQEFETLESAILAADANAPLPLNSGTWSLVTGGLLDVMQQAQLAEGVKLAAISAAASDRLLTEAILAGGVGLAAVVTSVLLLAWFGRKVTGDLIRLDASVLGMAEERLPQVVDQLRRGEDVDVHAASPPPAASGIAEISQIARSFGTVQEAAVAAAVEQARLRKGVNQVFLNISMRNQSLLHRQLGMLDAMERRTSDPGALADLFRLDHLTTRMRRHAEGLIILSGSTPGRGWREPVPVVDVLRAGVAEVEDYVRVDVLSESRDLVAGNAVNDVIHLIAELVENATVFSPPSTRIDVNADRAGTGLVVEIEDRGLGLATEEIAEINERLANPPEFNLDNSEQLGLFVVGRLAVRHSVQVALRRSLYGGTTAVIVLPFGVIVRAEEAFGKGITAGRRSSSLTADGFSADGFSADGSQGGSGTGTGTGPLPAFGATGRHRGSATAVGKRATAAAEPAPLGSHLGMPIRVPQANLAPQLRGRKESDQQPASAAPEKNERSAEATRNMMIMMQQGWERGRVDDLEDPAGAPGDGTDR